MFYNEIFFKKYKKKEIFSDIYDIITLTEPLKPLLLFGSMLKERGLR